MKYIKEDGKYVDADDIIALPVKQEIHRKGNTYEDGWKDLQKFIEERMPIFTADEVKHHGYWKTYTKTAYTAPPFTYKIIECSLCHNSVEHPWNFCPWCGGDMRGESE